MGYEEELTQCSQWIELPLFLRYNLTRSTAKGKINFGGGYYIAQGFGDILIEDDRGTRNETFASANLRTTDHGLILMGGHEFAFFKRSHFFVDFRYYHGLVNGSTLSNRQDNYKGVQLLAGISF